MTHALGYAEASTLNISTFRGQTVDPTSLIIAYTKYGDSNLDSVVTNSDLAYFVDGLATQIAPSWISGDYNYDGRVDLGNDFVLFEASLLS